jgi:hypothetical protein
MRLLPSSAKPQVSSAGLGLASILIDPAAGWLPSHTRTSSEIDGNGRQPQWCRHS